MSIVNTSISQFVVLNKDKTKIKYLGVLVLNTLGVSDTKRAYNILKTWKPVVFINPSSIEFDTVRKFVKAVLYRENDEEALQNLANTALDKTKIIMLCEQDLEGLEIEHCNKVTQDEFLRYLKPLNLYNIYKPVYVSNGDVIVDVISNDFPTYHCRNGLYCCWKFGNLKKSDDIDFIYENGVYYYKHTEKVYLLLDSRQRHKPYEIGVQINLDLKNNVAIMYRTWIENSHLKSGVLQFNTSSGSWILKKLYMDVEFYGMKRGQNYVAIR